MREPTALPTSSAWRAPLASARPSATRQRNVWFDGVEAEELLVVLDELGVCASAGSACASGALEPSHVLLAMGRSRDEAGRHVRYSLGRSTTKMDVDQAIAATSEAVARLRGAA